MSRSRQTVLIPDDAQAPVVGARSHWPSRSEKAQHTHSRHQLMYSQKGVIHVSTPTGSWILPPTKSIWISGGIPHALLVKRPVELTTLWVARDAPGAPHWAGCKVVSVSPLLRELLSVCSEQPWDYPPASRSSRLAQVLLEQLEAREQAPLELPELSDPRAERVAAMLRADPADRRPLVELASGRRRESQDDRTPFRLRSTDVLRQMARAASDDCRAGTFGARGKRQQRGLRGRLRDAVKLHSGL
jgi:hypothetical protein